MKKCITVVNIFIIVIFAFSSISLYAGGLLGGCNIIGQGEEGVIKVLGTVPEDGEEGVPLDTDIRVKLDKLINENSLSEKTFLVGNESLGDIEGVLSFQRSIKTIVFQPTNPLMPNKKYIVTVTTGIRGEGGETLKNEYQFTFTTSSGSTNKVYIDSVSPIEDNISLDTNIIIKFTKDVEESTLGDMSIVTDEGNVSYSLSYDDSTYTATLNPDGDLSYGKKYTVMIPDTITGVQGEEFDGYQFSFTTINAIYFGGYEAGGPDYNWVIKMFLSDGTEVTNGWDKKIPGSGGNNKVQFVGIGKNREIFVGGMVHDSYSRSDWVVRKYDINGNEDPNWGNQIGDSNYNNALGIDFDSNNNVIICGSDSANWTVRKYDQSFNLLKSYYKYDSYNDYAYGVAVDENDNDKMYVVGTDETSASGYDWEIAKFDSNLNNIWDKTFSNTGDRLFELGNRVEVDSNHYIYVIGSYDNGSDRDICFRKYNSNGELIWEKIIESGNGDDFGADLFISKEENIYIVGCLSNGDNYDAYIAEYDKDGNKLFEVTYPDRIAYRVDVDSNGNFVISGSKFNSDRDFWIAYFTSNNELQWEKVFDSGTGDDFGMGIGILK